jgi:hypothetical protein
MIFCRSGSASQAATAGSSTASSAAGSNHAVAQDPELQRVEDLVYGLPVPAAPP